MRTSSYEDYLKRICALTGQRRADLQTEEELMLREFFNRHMRFAWESYMWPEICLTEERTPVSDVISLTQASETEIGEVFACWRDDPNDTSYPREVPFFITADGIQFVGGQSYDPTYVFFRKRKPDFTGDAYDSATAYVTDDQVIDDGRFYKALQSSTGVATSNTSYWEALEIPYIFLEYVVAGAYADWLLADGNMEKAMMAANVASEVLSLEIDKIQRQQSQQPRLNVFRTHGTTQNRT